MRIEKKYEAELEKRKGLTKRTVLASVWLAVTFAISYLVAGWLLASEAMGYGFFYLKLGIPETVSEIVIHFGLAVFFFLLIQFIFLIGYAIASPKAKVRPGTPSRYSSELDPYDQSINYD